MKSVLGINVDWAALLSAFQMNMPEVRCFLSVEDGKVLKLPPGDPNLSIVQGDPQRFIAILAIPPRTQYQWLDEFIKSIPDEVVRGRMEAAINGKGAFRRFKDILLTLPEERRRWFEYRDQKMRQMIIDWVREQHIIALNEAPWLSGDISAYRTDPDSYDADFMPHAPQPVIPRTAPIPVNSQREIEALRDFFIEWFDMRSAASIPSPIELEQLTVEVGKHFRFKSLHS